MHAVFLSAEEFFCEMERDGAGLWKLLTTTGVEAADQKYLEHGVVALLFSAREKKEKALFLFARRFRSARDGGSGRYMTQKREGEKDEQ